MSSSTLKTITTIALTLSAALAHAAVNKGNIRGTVTHEASGEAVPGVTVTVSGPALQGEQADITDESGQYVVTELPPGEYLVRFYYADLVLERPAVVLSADQTLAVSITFDPDRASTEVVRITERAPTVDVGSPQLQTRITDTFARQVPVRGRTFDALLGFTPGSSRDEMGFSFGGASSPENAFLLDGRNTTNPAFGLIGSPLSLEFLEEANVITGGYNAEYGRAMGGVVSLVTKSGSNELHGSVFGNVQPFSLAAKEEGRIGEAIVIVPQRGASAFDFGFDVGGPIIADRLWFYVGFAPSFTTDRYDRVLRARLANDVGATSGVYDGDLEAAAVCPDYIDPALCTARGFATQAIAGRTTELTSTARNFSYIGKLDLRLDDDNRFALSYNGNPITFTGVYRNPGRPNSAGNLAGAGFNAAPSQMRFRETMLVHDVGAHFISKLLERSLQLEVIAGYHRADITVAPEVSDRGQVTDGRVTSIATYENVPECAIQTLPSGATFNPCPVQNYTSGGFGLQYDQDLQRFSGGLSATYLLDLAGTHALKLGGDFEASRYINRRSYTGGAYYTIFSDAFVNQTAYSGFDGPNRTEPSLHTAGFVGDTTSQSEAFYLRDSYTMAFLPGGTLNLGVRWELQQLQNQAGETVFNLTDNIAPRAGFVYDWTQRGLSKVYASYGRFYEAVPMDLLDRYHSGEGISNVQSDTCDAPRVAPESCTFPEVSADTISGGSFGLVAPKVRGQYSNEIVAGVEVDVGMDLVVGAAFVHRDLGRVIEDFSTDGARTFFIGNPGEAPDEDEVNKLQGDIEALNQELAGAGSEGRAAIEAEKAEKTSLLAAYQAAGRMAKPERNYNALVLTAHKRFSQSFTLLASYTYSRTLGDYDGLFQSSTKQLDPNILSSYDLPDLLLNRAGPLPQDRPHNLKLAGAYFIGLGESEDDGVTVGASLNAISGAPINVLGGFPFYGRRMSFILPRGSGGRTPMLWSFDLHVGFTQELSKGYRLELAVDIFNVFNQRGVVSVDEEYTIDPVLAIPNGAIADLAHLTTTAGGKPTVNPSFGQPLEYQTPMSMRLGARISF